MELFSITVRITIKEMRMIMTRIKKEVQERRVSQKMSRYLCLRSQWWPARDDETRTTKEDIFLSSLRLWPLCILVQSQVPLPSSNWDYTTQKSHGRVLPPFLVSCLHASRYTTIQPSSRGRNHSILAWRGTKHPFSENWK